MAQLFNKARAVESKRFYSHHAEIGHSRDMKSFESYFKRDKGQLGINLIEMDVDNEVGIFEIELASKSSPNIKTTIEADFENGQVITNPMEIIHQDQEFFEKVTNDVFHHSRKKDLAPELTERYKADLDEVDYRKMAAIADKINEKIETSLHQEVKIDKDFGKEQEEPKKKQKRNLKSGLGMSM